MPKIICTLPNAAGVINGVAFVSHKLGMISEEIGQDVADHFASIPGYQLATSRGQPVKQPDPSPAGDGQTSVPLPGATGGDGITPAPASQEAPPGTD